MMTILELDFLTFMAMLICGQLKISRGGDQTAATKAVMAEAKVAN